MIGGMQHGGVCPECGDIMFNSFYYSEDHVCVKKADSDSMFRGFEALLTKWLPFSTYMAERRLAI